MHHALGEAWLEAHRSAGWPPRSTHHVVSEASLQHTARGSYATVHVVPGTDYTLRWCLAPPKSPASANPHLSLASLKLNGVETGQRLLGNRASHLDSKLASILHRALLAGPALPSRVFSSDELSSEPLSLASEEREPGFEARYSLVLRIWRQPAVVARALDSGKHATLHDIIAGTTPTVCFDFVCVLDAPAHAIIPLPMRTSTPELLSRLSRRTSEVDKEEARRSQLPHAAANYPQLIGRTGHHQLTSSHSASPLGESRARSPSPSGKLWSRFSVSSSEGRRSRPTTPNSESTQGRTLAPNDFCWPVRRPEPSLHSGSASSRTETGSRSSRRFKARSPRTSNASSGAPPSSVGSGPPALAALYSPSTTLAHMPPDADDVLVIKDPARLSRVVEAKPQRRAASPASARSSWLGGTLEGIGNLGRRRSAATIADSEKPPTGRATPEPVSIAQAPTRPSRRPPTAMSDGKRSPWQRLRTVTCHAAEEEDFRGTPALPRSHSGESLAQSRQANLRSGSLPSTSVRPVAPRPDSLAHYASGSPGLRVSTSTPGRLSPAALPRTPERPDFVTELDDIDAEQSSLRGPGNWQPSLGALTEASFDLPTRTFLPDESETEMESAQWHAAPEDTHDSELRSGSSLDEMQDGELRSGSSSDSTWRSSHSHTTEAPLYADESLASTASTEGPLATVEIYADPPVYYANPHVYDADTLSPMLEGLSCSDEHVSPVDERTSFFEERASYAETFGGHTFGTEYAQRSYAETFGHEPARSLRGVDEENDSEAGSSDSFLTAVASSQDTWTATRAELQTSVSHIQSMESEINNLLVQEASLRRELAERAALTQACLESHRESVKFLTGRLESPQPGRRDSRSSAPGSPRPTSPQPASRPGGVRPLMLLRTDLPPATPLSAPPSASHFARHARSPSGRSSPSTARLSLSPSSAGRPERWSRREGLPYSRPTPHADGDSLDGLDAI